MVRSRSRRKVCDNERRDAHQQYHKVAARDVMSGTANPILCAEELNERVAFAFKYHGGRIDKKHAKWMHEVYEIVKKSNMKSQLTLSVLIAIDRTRRYVE
jgi:hypothetical protein